MKNIRGTLDGLPRFAEFQYEDLKYDVNNEYYLPKNYLQDIVYCGRKG